MRQLGADLSETHSQHSVPRTALPDDSARIVLLRYKQTAMGFGWALLTPLLNTVIFSDLSCASRQSTRACAVSAFRVLRAARVELHRVGPALCGHVAHLEYEPGDESVFPARDLSVRRPSPCRSSTLRSRRRCSSGDAGLLPRRSDGRRSSPCCWSLLVQAAFTVSAGALLAMAQSLLPRRQVPVRSRSHGLDVRERGRSIRARRSRGGSG